MSSPSPGKQKGPRSKSYQQQHQENQGRRSKEQKQQVARRADTEQEDHGTYDLIKVARALLARMLFIVHSLITIWQTVEVYQKQAYWSFSLITIAILIEGVVTLLQRAGDENRWFCPCVFLFVLSTVPPIWFLELDLSGKRLAVYTGNTSVYHMATAFTQVESTLHISHELSVQMVEQFLLVILIVGRWMLPKGVITREQLSQILLAYLAIASDIVELFDVFKEVAVVRHKHLRYLVLAIWSLSLFQFPFVLTASKARKMRIAITQSTTDEEMKRIQSRITAAQGGRSTLVQVIYDADIWAILLANFLQDVPFLIVRLYLMLGYKVITYTMIFFTCKNALIIALQTYRLFILIHDRYQKPTPEDDARRLARHYRQMLTHCKEALATLKQNHPHLSGHKRDNGTNDGGGTTTGNLMKKSGSREGLQSPTTVPPDSISKASCSPREETGKRKAKYKDQRKISSSHELEVDADRKGPIPSPSPKRKIKKRQVTEERNRRHSRSKQPGGTPTRKAKHQEDSKLLP